MATHTTRPVDAVLLPPRPGGQRLKLAIAASVLAVALGYFGFVAFQSAKVYYLTVGEVLDGSSPSQVVRVSGKLVPGSYQRAPGSTQAQFAVSDGSRVLQVQYDGPIPELFWNPQSDIVSEGTYQGNGTFDATAILVKCPSKYEAKAES